MITKRTKKFDLHRYVAEIFKSYSYKEAYINPKIFMLLRFFSPLTLLCTLLLT